MSNTITINVETSVSTGPSSGYLVLDGDFTSLFFPGFQFVLFNGTENLSYTTVSSVLTTGKTQVTVSGSVVGSIVSLGSVVPGFPPFVSGTYTPVSTTGGAGTGAQLQVVIVGPGPINSLGTIIGGIGYVNGSYVAVPLTGGTGTGAEATIVVSGGFVVQVVITNPGIGYDVADVLSADPLFDGSGLGTGFSVPVLTVLGSISSVTLISAGVGYMVSDILSFGGLGYGTNSTIPVTSVTSTEMGTITLQNNQPMFTVGEVVYCITAGNAACQTPWWSQLPSQTPIPAVQSGTVLAVTVLYMNATPSPTITYSIRLGSQPGVVLLDQSVVFIDKQTAIDAYEAMSL